MATETPAAPATTGVTLKPNAIESQPAAIDNTASDLPYHTKETEKIAEKNAKAAEKLKDAPYKYEVNGFTVTEIEGQNAQANDQSDANKLWKVEGPEDFEKVFTNKRSAEIFVETHSSAVASMPATFPST